MLLNFFFALRKGGLPVSINELLTLLETLKPVSYTHLTLPTICSV